MSLFDWHNRSMPKHYKYMYLDGFTPEQVFLSLHQRMKEEYFDQQDEAEIFIIESEVKIEAAI